MSEATETGTKNTPTNPSDDEQQQQQQQEQKVQGDDVTDSKEQRTVAEDPEKKPKKKFRFPTTERAHPEIPPPIAERLPHDELFDEQGKPNISKLQDHLFHEGKLLLTDVIYIIEEATDIFSNEPTLLNVSAPVSLCGDVHGQYYDLLKLFEVGGKPGETTYLFLGDYVDRGNFSVECVLLLYCYKMSYPNNFFMLRGNHECRHLTDYFTFKEECLHKYNQEIYDLFMDSFDALPLAALMNEQFLCLHGGISPTIRTLNDIQNIDRFKEPPQHGPMCDILWADPMEDFNDESCEPFKFNEIRGCSYLFSFGAISEFLERNSLLCLIRAHEAQDMGYKMHRKSKETGFPTVITLFSAPNYLDNYHNKGAILRYEDNVMNIRQFNNCPHPYWLPNFMDVFTWSLPFVAEKVAEFLLGMLKICDDEEDEEDYMSEEELKQKKREQLRVKIRSISRVMRMYSTLRSERESILILKGLCERNTLPKGLLSAGPAAIREALGNFQKARTADLVNEKLPATPQVTVVKEKKMRKTASLRTFEIPNKPQEVIPSPADPKNILILETLENKSDEPKTESQNNA